MPSTSEIAPFTKLLSERYLSKRAFVFQAGFRSFLSHIFPLSVLIQYLGSTVFANCCISAWLFGCEFSVRPVDDRKYSGHFNIPRDQKKTPE